MLTVLLFFQVGIIVKNKLQEYKRFVVFVVEMLPLPAEESEVKTNSNEVMSPPALTDEPPKKRRRSSGSGTAKGTKIRMRE